MTPDEGHEIAMPTEISPEASQRIQQEILARQTWPSYQDMLVSYGFARLLTTEPNPVDPCPQRQRANLPIAAYRTEIMNTIEDSQCIVLCGETGW